MFRYAAHAPKARISHNTNGTAERCSIERALSIILIFAFLPLLILIYSIILIGGQKPLFRQMRIGKHNSLFLIMKFRTIWCDDSRVGGICEIRKKIFLPISKVLRTTGLDELPQLLNIAKGEMAFIGPRPLTPADHAALPPARNLRLAVKPGLTGLAQVNGGQALGATEKLAFDIYYIERRSRRLDLYIVYRSLRRVVRGERATSMAQPSLRSAAHQHWAETSSRSAVEEGLAA